MRRKNTESIAEVLRQFFEENAFIKTKLAESRVVSGWGKMFGAVVSSYTTNIYLRNNVLYVHLNSSVLRSELLMSKEKIIANLNVHAGMNVVKDIIFR
jgi:predicted nucleic acid-binding Zn ribbon protein